MVAAARFFSQLVAGTRFHQGTGKYCNSTMVGGGRNKLDEVRIRVNEQTKTKGLADMENDDCKKKSRYSNWISLRLTISILSILAAVCTLTVPNLGIKSLYDIELWKWGVMILVVICSGLVSGWAIQIMVFFLERILFLGEHVLYFVYLLKSAAQICSWMGLILIAWQCKLFKLMTRGNNFSRHVTNILICLLLGAFIWSIKTLIIEVLASKFHISNYFPRIRDSLCDEYVIKAFLGPPIDQIQQQDKEEDWKPEEGENAGPSLPLADKNRTMIEHLQRMNQKNISAKDMNGMMNVIITTMLTNLDEAFTQITNEDQAKSAAEKIFCKVTKAGSEDICLEDLERFLPGGEAIKKLTGLSHGPSERKRISKQALQYWVVNVLRERRALALSLEDMKSAMDMVHLIMNVVVAFIILMISVLIFEASMTRFLIVLISVLTPLVLGRGIFTSLKFLFIMHPFDVCDRCEINGEQMIVEKIYILNTVFLGNGKLKKKYSNSALSTKGIGNYRNSPDMSEEIDFSIETRSSQESVDEMENLVTRYVENESEHWQPGPEIIVTGIVDSDSNRLKRSLCVRHRMNFQDMGERFKRRAILVRKMMEILENLEITYYMIPMENNVSNFPALSSERVPSNWRVCAN